MKQEGRGLEKRKHVVGARSAQTCKGQQTQPSPNAPYNIVNGNLRNFEGIFRHGADVALILDADEHEAKRMGN